MKHRKQVVFEKEANADMVRKYFENPKIEIEVFS